MIGDTIKWRIKIVNLLEGIFLGIGLKKVLTRKGFVWENADYDKHGCYIVAKNGDSYTYMDK